MSKETRYTLWIEKGVENDDVVVARGLTPIQAAKRICEYGNAKPCLYDRAYETFRSVELHQYNSKYELLGKVGATVPLTDDRDADMRHAMDMIDTQIFARYSEFWPGRVSTDDRYDVRLQKIAKARAIQALDRLITTELVEELLQQGYSITCCVRWDDPSFKESKDRDGILAHLFKLDMAEIDVHKNGITSRIVLVFCENGWDVVVGHSDGLEDLIDPVIRPHLPWNKPDAGPEDGGYPAVALPSPADLDKGAPAAENAFDDFIDPMGRLH